MIQIREIIPPSLYIIFI